MKKRTSRPNWAVCTAAVLLWLVMISSSMVSMQYARFTTGSSAEDSARAAAFVFQVNGEENLVNLSNIRVPGDTQTITFTVSNGNGKSEVDETYTLTLKELGSLPLTYTLTNADSSWNADTAEETVTRTGSFSAAVSGSQSYTLTVTWDETKEGARDPKYAGGVASLRLGVIASQID